VIRVYARFFRRGVDKKNAFGLYNALYKAPRYLYTKSTPSFIYFVVRGKLEEKEIKYENKNNK